MIEDLNAQNYSIPGLNPNEADRFVDLAFRNNDIRDIERRSSNPNTRAMARGVIALHDSEIGEISGMPAVAETVVEAPAEFRFVSVTSQDLADRDQISSLKSPKQETVEVSAPAPRRRQTQVVDPATGRIVPYGQMRHGNHPQGGRIVRR